MTTYPPLLLPASQPITSPAAAPTPNPGRRAWRFFTAILLLMTTFVLLIVVGIGSFLRLSSDVRALREGVLGAGGIKWQKQFEINVGPLTTSLARSLLGFVKVDSEVQAVLSAVRAGEVGVYRLSGQKAEFNPAAMLDAADNAMQARNWQRSVVVTHQEALVAVYTPAGQTSPRKVKACVVVVNDGQMVIASAHSNLEPLLDFALHSKGRRHFFPARRADTN